MSEPNTNKLGGRPAPPEHRERARHMREELGEQRTVKELKISRPTLARVLAEMPVKEGTLALLRERFGSAAGADDDA